MRLPVNKENTRNKTYIKTPKIKDQTPSKQDTIDKTLNQNTNQKPKTKHQPDKTSKPEKQPSNHTYRE